MAAQAPAGPQSVGGLGDPTRPTFSDRKDRSRILNNVGTCEKPIGAKVVRHRNLVEDRRACYCMRANYTETKNRE
jgi:hypothetical protein